MARKLVAIFLAATFAIAGVAAAQPGQTPNSTDLRGIHPIFPPTPAAQAGYVLRTFGPFIRYGGNWNDHTFYSPEPQGAQVATQNEDGSIYLTGQGNTYGIATAKHTGTGTWTGVAFGGGFYIEVVARFTAQPQAVQPWASLAIYAIEDMAFNAVTPTTQWPGQASNYGQGLEIDVFEADASSQTAYGNGGHSWYGPLGAGRPDVHTSFSSNSTVPSSLNNTEDVRFGFLWIPATPGMAGSGRLAWFFNGMQRASVNYDPYNAALAPPPVLGSSAFSVIDIRHLVPCINTNPSLPMQIKSISVWQKSNAGNLVQ